MQIGRIRLETSEPYITKENIIPILRKVLPLHEMNANRHAFLDNYEKGEQPLCRTKTYRPDIDVQTNDNVANEITEFKTAYHWGNPITVIQRGETKGNNEEITEAISIINAGYKTEGMDTKTQHLGRNIELSCQGYTYVDVNMDEEDIKDGGSYFKVESLEVSNTFVVYSSYYADKRPMLGVMYRIDDSGKKHITAFSYDTRFELVGYEHTDRSGEKNPLGIIPIVHWIRSYDGLGCFERQIPEMDALNLEISDIANDIDQECQAIWHGNDISFPNKQIKNKDGSITEEKAKPKTNDWIITETTQDGKTPFIKPLAIGYDYEGMLSNVMTKRALILQKCSVPQRNDNSGGSTGIAMDSATGWSAAETVAQKQQLIMETCKMQELKVVLRAIRISPYVPADSPLLKLKISDLEPSIKRSKTYELTVKTNAAATLLGKGFFLGDVLEMIPMCEDNNQVLERSGKGVRKYQEAQVFKIENKAETEEKRLFGDNSDQQTNSPLIGGMSKEE